MDREPSGTEKIITVNLSGKLQDRYLLDLDIADHRVVPKVLNMYDICIIMLFVGWEVNEKL